MAQFRIEQYNVKVYLESSMTYLGTKTLRFLASKYESGDSTITKYGSSVDLACILGCGYSSMTTAIFSGMSDFPKSELSGSNRIEFDTVTGIIYRYVFENDNYMRIWCSYATSQEQYYSIEYHNKNGGTIGSTATLTSAYIHFSGPSRYIANGQFLCKPLDSSNSYFTGIKSGTFNGNEDGYFTEENNSYITLSQSINAIYSFFNGVEPLIPDDDNPYWDGGTSEEGGGGGNFSEDSDDPTTDDLPSIDAVGTGMATIFKPDRSQLRALSELFWNSNVFTFLQNLVENITNMFVSLAMVPFDVQAGSTVSVTWLGIDTAVSLTLAAKQFYEFNMGTIDLANDSRIFTSGSALDYAPFSSLGIYLPFIGYRDLDIDECRDAGVNLRYRVDILSGSCVAIVKVGGKDIYEFTGNCLTQIPITNENMQSLVSDAVNIGLAVANAESAGAVASGVEADAIAAGEPLSAEKSAHMDQMVSRSRGQLASATANAAMGMKPNFAKTGAVSGSVAMMSVKQPYLFLKTPRQSIPEHYQRYCGFPSNISGRLGDFSGYTVVEDIRLNGLVATSPEVAEIYKLLKSGVII